LDSANLILLEIDNDPSFVSELESYSFRNSTYKKNLSKSDERDYDRYIDDTKYSWNNHINALTVILGLKSVWILTVSVVVTHN